ncbi:MAG: epimerase [Nocardioides sp.]|nr:epimerase [Nocardioides sp.]
MSTLVVGRGLLGRHVVSRLADRGADVRTVDVPWADPAAALEVLVAAADEAARTGPDWRIAWCAGAGVVSTPLVEFDSEVALFRRFTTSIGKPPRAFFLASSAGGVYAGSSDPPHTEHTEPRPLAPYGWAKLAMEDSARTLADRGSRVVLGRISNLYGPGQDLAKSQGLISRLCLTQVTGTPLQLYVSMDTLRDYLFVSDAADLVAACLDRAAGTAPGTVTVKVLASGVATSVGTLIQASTRAFRRRTRVVQSSPPRLGAQVRDLRLRSRTWTDLDVLVRTPLVVGLSATAESVDALHRAGALAHRFP